MVQAACGRPDVSRCGRRCRILNGLEPRIRRKVAAMTPCIALDRTPPMWVWFTDEARVGQQGTLTRVWAKRGSRPRALRDRRYEWAYLFGAICPERRTGAAIIMPEVNIEAMNLNPAVVSPEPIGRWLSVYAASGAPTRPRARRC